MTQPKQPQEYVEPPFNIDVVSGGDWTAGLGINQPPLVVDGDDADDDAAPTARSS